MTDDEMEQVDRMSFAIGKIVAGIVTDDDEETAYIINDIVDKINSSLEINSDIKPN